MSKGTVIRVQLQPRKGYYSSLSEAIKDAPMNSTISVAAGTYLESDLVFNKPNLSIVAEGDGMPIVKSHGIAAIVSASAPSPEPSVTSPGTA